MVAWSRFSTEYPERSYTTVQNLLVRETWLPAFVLPCYTNSFSSSKIYFAANPFPSLFSNNLTLHGLTNKHENVWRIGHFFSLGTSSSECWSPNIRHLTSSETTTSTHWIGCCGTTGLVWNLWWREKALPVLGTEPQSSRNRTHTAYTVLNGRIFPTIHHIQFRQPIR